MSTNPTNPASLTAELRRKEWRWVELRGVSPVHYRFHRSTLPIEAADRIEALEGALLAVVHATRAYLPPDGIDAQECINRILAATDNKKITPLIMEIENGHH